jgi:hypothetical protein
LEGLIDTFGGIPFKSSGYLRKIILDRFR